MCNYKTLCIRGPKPEPVTEGVFELIKMQQALGFPSEHFTKFVDSLFTEVHPNYYKPAWYHREHNVIMNKQMYELSIV